MYFLWAGDEIVYVGRSENLFQRIGTHVDNPEIEFDSFTWEEHLSYESMVKSEARCIKELKPRHNKEGNPDYKPDKKQFWHTNRRDRDRIISRRERDAKSRKINGL